MTTARDRPPEEAAEDTSFARGLRLLLTVADRGEVRADELGTLLDMPLSTVYRYLRTLGDFGFVDRQWRAQFRLGPKLLIGTGANVSSERLIRHADAALRMLVHETGETAIVVRRIGLSSVCLHQIESEAAAAGDRASRATCAPLYAGAPGRALLAFAPPEVLDEILAQDLVRITRQARRPRTSCARRLGGIVMTGMATSEGELHRRVRSRWPRRSSARTGSSVRSRVVGTGIPLRRGVAGSRRPAAPGGGPGDQRGARRGPVSAEPVLLSRIVA